MKHRLLLALLLLLVVSGCSTVPAYAPQHLDWPQREAALQQITAWQLEGRIAIRTADDSWSGSLWWQQLDDTYEIKFSGPFGQGAINLVGDQQQVVLNSSEGEIVGHDGAEQLMYEQLGWRVPISSLRYWVLGRPDPTKNSSLLEFDDFDRIKSLQQGGWSVNYRRYQLFQQLDVPGKIAIKNHQLGVKLVIDHWQQPEKI